MTGRAPVWMAATCCACSVPTASGAPPAQTLDAGVDASRLEDVTFERRVFRHVLVGKLRYPSQRHTWVLYRGATRARPELYGRAGRRDPVTGISLDGKENDEGYWLAPVFARDTGVRMGASPLTYRLDLEVAPSGGSECSGAPPAASETPP